MYCQKVVFYLRLLAFSLSSFSKHLLKTYYVPGTGYILVNKRDKVLALMELTT